MITPSPDVGRADFRLILWLFAWLTVGGLGWLWVTLGGGGDLSAVFAGAPR